MSRFHPLQCTEGAHGDFRHGRTAAFRLLIAVSVAWFAATRVSAADAQPSKDAQPPAEASERPPGVADQSLRQELLDRVAADQKARFAMIRWMREEAAAQKGDSNRVDLAKAEAVQKLDRDNTQWLKGVVERSGWPNRSRVGEDGAHAAWLLVQHADHDPGFQKTCLQLMQAAPPGEVSLTDVAYLTDRVMVKETNQQLYGTQARLVNGKCEPLPLKDPARVDELRKSVGLPPLRDYLKSVEELYAKPAPDDGTKRGPLPGPSSP